ncbi:hypothetical protein MTY59_03210 [Mycobacterium senriense]|uniref:Uncharacterized protein n=1 Tax=Mycobacterium senriense TaxID=2775496 RepID=A0ABN6IBP6_9MYCO|nr:hypothetical protein MTY59_03210 [Mycobacterium senriense]
MSKVGPGPSDTNGTVTTASNTPNATIGTSATIRVRMRLFTPITLDGGRGAVFSHNVRLGGFSYKLTRGRAV